MTELKTQRYYYDNLMIMRDYFDKNIKTIQPKLSMLIYRDCESSRTHECKSFGCILGHAIAIPAFKEHFVFNSIDEIDFEGFSKNAFNIVIDSKEWNHLFGATNPDYVNAFIDRLDEHLVTFDLDNLDEVDE